jgi:glycine cleavage system transcriptional repressor
MANYALMTAVGKDRPGIVSAVSGVLFNADCNIEDSTMARLGGTFSIMLVLRLPEGLISQQLREKMKTVVDEFGLWLHLEDMRPEEAVEPTPETPKHLIHVYGADKKGIVHRITKHLADQSVNVTNLHTQAIRHDQPLYVMLIEVEIPSYVDAGALKEELGKIGDQLDVHVSFKPKDDARF